MKYVISGITSNGSYAAVSFLHQVECSFHIVPGKVYHLYRRRNNSVFLSTLPPEDMDKSIQDQDTFLGSYLQEEGKDKVWQVANTQCQPLVSARRV